MAMASCGQHWSWSSPMLCSGKIIDDKHKKVDKMCYSCPWWKENNNTILDEDYPINY